MKIRRRKLELYMIRVPMINRDCRTIYVTKKQLEKLNAVPVGKEIFLSCCHCYDSGGFHVLRTNNGLQYMPNPHRNLGGDDGLAQFFEM